MKKLLCILFSFLFFICNAHTAQIVNVEYIHNLISQEWDITVPYNPALSNVKSIANMKYLLTAIDVANEILNGEKTTDYGNGEFATTRITDTIATNQAVEQLIKKEQKHEFSLTTISTNSFSFKISAAGEFTVDWGDGTVETITKADTTNTTYSHTYSASKSYTIGIDGQATAYNTDSYVAAISFYVNSSQTKIKSIDGSLGAIFGTLTSGEQKQPRFYKTFYNASNMTGTIPKNLFAGISGAPADNMFYDTFNNCRDLTGVIPDSLFAGIYGAPAPYMFDGTFAGCRNLTSIPVGLFAGISGAPAEGMFEGTFTSCNNLTSIPEGLFAGISGAPAERMFEGTFAYCSNLTSIPEGLFAGISGAPAERMFCGTFYNCRALTSIPENPFGNISGYARDGMFGTTNGLISIAIGGTLYFIDGAFGNCTSLTGPSARINGKYLYEIWPYATEDQVGDMYSGATGLEDYRCIPTNWGGQGEVCSSDDFYEFDGYKFSMTVDMEKVNADCFHFWGDEESATSEFGINISAAGTFYIDWGDGTTETIKKTDTKPTDYFHDYGTKNGIYTIQIGGKAIGYAYTTAFSYPYANSPCAMYENGITSINGSLGAIFSTLPDGTQPIFASTFSGCTNLTSIPDNLFDGISGNLVDGMFIGTFSYCHSLTGPSARINGKYLYEIWPDATINQVGYMYDYSTRLDDYRCIPTAWGGLGEDCSVPENDYKFFLTTTSTSSFSFSITAAGEFYVDWGDGTVETITKTNTTETTYSHNYTTAGAYTIGLSGQATAYSTDEYIAAIKFSADISSIDGSLGAIFGTLADGSQPRFFYTFNSSLITSIPENLFAGISGAPASNMFYNTFGSCSGLTSIPDGLFAGIYGAPASGMFRGTFMGCRSLTSIPRNLFGNISGPAQNLMFAYTFAGCSGLTGPSARINGKYIYEIWPSNITSCMDMYNGATGLSDYSSMPIEFIDF